MRNLSLDLRPAMIDDLGLVATLRWYLDRQSQRGEFAQHFTVTSSGEPLPAKLKIACFRVMQEALTNVSRHAQARNVWVELRQSADDVELVIRDDGGGFDPGTGRGSVDRGESFGLFGMKERVGLLGGEVEITSRPGYGTSIRARLPIEHRTDAAD